MIADEFGERTFATPSGWRPPPAITPGYAVGSSTLGLLLLAVALFPRLLTALGAPAVLNFAHFPAAAGFIALALPGLRGRLAARLIAGMGALFLVMCSSALLNGTGVLNALLDFPMLSEPFILLLLIATAPMSALELTRFRSALLGFAFIHVALANYQALALGAVDDDVKGIFLAQGAGHHVGGAVALTAAAYIVAGSVPWSLGLRAACVLACVMVTLFSDSKQVVAVFLASLGVMTLLRVQDLRRLALYLLLAPGTLMALWLVRDSFPLLPLLLETWRVEGGVQAKLAVFPLLSAHMQSAAHWLLGLGPGSTVGRLATQLPDYIAYLIPLGATTSPITNEILAARDANYYSNVTTGSSVWSPTFSWAGIWGDLGLVGLGIYLLLWWLVWRNVCRTELSRFLLLTLLLFGAVFSWLEEPAYMLFVAAVLGLEWQAWRTHPGLPLHRTALPLAEGPR